MRFPVFVFMAVVLPLAVGCQADPVGMHGQKSVSGPRPHTAQGIVAMPFNHPLPWLVTGGQPKPEDWLALRGRQITTVINLRTDAEMGKRDEASEVKEAGLVYEHLPVAGAQDIDTAHADDLWKRIHAAPGRVMVHCASGNRVGALLAIGAARHGDMSPQQAIELGRRAGLTRLEPKVREVLGLPPSSDTP
ncbi:MAG: sulfur transferase domain-containing protein [Rhodanobacteraceae bacterium]